jgi:hypothetical protein
MLEFVLSWTFISVVVPVIVGAGLGVMSTSLPEFTAAKWYFNAAYLILIVRLSWLAVMEQPEEGPPVGGIIVFFLSILLSGLWIRVMN